MLRRAVYFIAALVALAVIYQFCFRYEYLSVSGGAESGGAVFRVDRLTQSVCIMPCKP
jgi:hypothetical protein